MCSARGNRSDRRLLIAERNPDVGVGLRLAFHELIASLRPEQDALVLIVEDVLALVGSHGQYGMTLVLFVAHHGHQQCLPRPAGLDQHASLEQDVVLAITVAVIRIGPAVDHSPMFDIGQRFNSLVGPGVDPNQVHPRPPRERKLGRYRCGAGAFARLPCTEVYPARWGLCGSEDTGAPLGSCYSRKHVNGACRYRDDEDHPQLCRQEFIVHGMAITQSGCPAMLGTGRCSLPAMLETPNALSVPNRGGLR